MLCPTGGFCVVQIPNLRLAQAEADMVRAPMAGERQAWHAFRRLLLSHDIDDVALPVMPSAALQSHPNHHEATHALRCGTRLRCKLQSAGRRADRIAGLKRQTRACSTSECCHYRYSSSYVPSLRYTFSSFPGAGAGGASAAYHLSKFANAARVPVNITIFERNSTAGGRSTTVNAYDDPALPIELGASIFVKVNSILNDAVREFNLSTEDLMPKVENTGAALGVWDGHDFVLQMSSGWWDTAKLLWKYGLAPVKTMRLMRKVVGQFLQMYDEPVFPFEDLTQAAQDLGLLPVTAATGEQYLAENGITGSFGWDVVQASTRVNYASNLRYIHGLEAMVCMAAEGGEAVQGGNWQIFDRMIAASTATALYDTEVKRIERHSDGRYSLGFKTVGSDFEELRTGTELFDSVILAAPYQFMDLELPGQGEYIPDKIPYVQLHTTLFTSPHLPCPAFFDLPNGKLAPRSILTTLPKDEEPREGKEGVGSPGFFSVSLLQSTTNPSTSRQEYAYKIFSAEPPNSTLLAHLLGLKQPHDDAEDVNPESGLRNKDITWIHRKLWHSYPYEYPRVTFERIRLDEDLWYTSAMDAFISTMETNALSGMNVARMVVDKRVKELEAAEYELSTSRRQMDWMGSAEM